MKATLFKYIFKIQAMSMLFAASLVFGIILLFDFSDAMRRFSIEHFNDIMFVMKISMLRSFATFFEILHYVYFTTATFSLWSLCKSNQLIIIKSIGGSPMQILYPFISFAALVSMFWLIIANPIALKSEILREEMITKKVFSMENNNVWVDCKNTKDVAFFKTIKGIVAQNVFINNVESDKKIIAKIAYLNNDEWKFESAAIVDKDTVQYKKTHVIAPLFSEITVQMLSKSPQKHDIFSLLNIYKVQESNNVNLKEYEIELHKRLSHSIFFILCALMAAVICFPINRYKSKTNVVLKMIMLSIVLRFFNNIFESFAYSGIITPALACWSVMIIAMCSCISILTWKEV